MAMIKIPYGTGALTLEVPADTLAGVLVPRETPAARDGRALVREALANPIGSPPVSILARGKARVLVITSDHTRPVPSRVTLPPLLDELRKGAPGAQFRVLIASGTHRPPQERELRAKFGNALYEQLEIGIHDCDAPDAVFRGTLPSGGELWLNKWIDWADLVVAEGFIEPHVFAGFSGGRKSILPGVAARRTIYHNHSAMMIGSRRAAPGVLSGNPVHEDMAFAAQRAGLAFILNVLVDDEKRVAAAFAGDPAAAHEAGCRTVEAHHRVASVTADIVVASNGGSPLDLNVYQSVKGLTAAAACVREGGVIVMCCALGDGDGTGGRAFFEGIAGYPNPRAALEAIARRPPGETTGDQWSAQILARILCRARCVFVTGARYREMIEALHMTWAGSLEEALGIARRLCGAQASVAVIPNGTAVIVG